jgi:hypothetical protein
MKSELLKELLDHIEQVVTSWQFYPEGEYGAAEAIIETQLLIDLQTIFEKYEKIA